MIAGEINWLLDAIVTVNVEDATGHTHSFRCILDTGFDGDLVLTSAAIERLGLVQSFSRQVTFADGSQAYLATYEARASWLDQLVDVVVLQGGHESIVGMSLLEDCSVTMQVWDGGDILVERR